MKLRMSFFVTRPPRPVPCTRLGSTPCSDAIFATTGDTNVLPLVCAACAGSGGACCDGATSTVAPSCTRISVRTPLPGLGTSVSTLSVEISSRGSSASTCSPCCLSHLVIVPSETDTPICGITTSIASVVAMSLLVLSQLAQTCRDVVDLWDERLLERRRERHRRIGGSDPLERCIEILERLLGDRRRDLRAEAAGAGVLVQYENLRRLAYRLEHRALVPGHHRAEIDDLDGDAVGLELLRRFVCGVDHRTPGDHRHVLALAVRARLPEWHGVALLGHLALDAPVEMLVLEIEDGIRILDRADQQPLRVLGSRRADALEAGDVCERRLGILRMERSAREAAAP